MEIRYTYYFCNPKPYVCLLYTSSQLNNTISTQNELIRSLQKMLQERDAKDSEKDQLIANLQAQLD